MDEVITAMSESKSLENTGVVTVNAEGNLPAQRTIVVLGAPRGGTSMVAGALHHLGVYMGERLGDATFEDSVLCPATNAQDERTIASTIASRNADYRIWGWKQAQAFEYYVSDVADKLRNPVYVAVFRDVVAVGNRKRISGRSKMFEGMLATLTRYRQITEFLRSTSAPILLVSYEKAVADCKAFVDELARFAGVTDPARLQAAESFIEPAPKAYLQKAVLRKPGARAAAKAAKSAVSRGRVLQLTPGKIKGWAMYLDRATEAAEVQLVVRKGDDTFEMSCHASEFRKGALDSGKHPTGQCGFTFSLPPGQELTGGERISVSVKGDSNPLPGCPPVFRAGGRGRKRAGARG